MTTVLVTTRLSRVRRPSDRSGCSTAALWLPPPTGWRRSAVVGQAPDPDTIKRPGGLEAGLNGIPYVAVAHEKSSALSLQQLAIGKARSSRFVRLR